MMQVQYMRNVFLLSYAVRKLGARSGLAAGEPRISDLTHYMNRHNEMEA